MARTQSLASMTVDALLKFRDDIGAALKQKADGLKKELRSLGSDYAQVGRIALYGKSKLAGTKVAAKYRDPATGETWSGRGAPSRWLVAYERQGKKREDFLIAKPAKKGAPKKRKTRRKKR